MRIQKEKKSDLALFRMQGDCDNRKRCTAPTNGESFYYLETAPLARSKTNTKYKNKIQIQNEIQNEIQKDINIIMASFYSSGDCPPGTLRDKHMVVKYKI